MRTRKRISDGWEFCFDEKCGESLPAEQVWQPVTLPHDWQIWHVSNLYQDGTGWYRRVLTWQPGARCCLYFEGVYMDATVFVGGKTAAEWKYGYSSFEVDVTDFLQPGENELLVRVCLRHPNSRWYSGAGIYRDVWRIDCPQSHLVTDGLYLSVRELSGGLWQLTAGAETEDAQAGDLLEYTLLNAGGETVTAVSAAVGQSAVLTVENPY